MGVSNLEEDRFWSKVNKSHANGCWEWIGNKLKTGYGKFKLNGKQIYAHRYSYHLIHFNFPIENKHHLNTLDHLCRNSSCVNPDHLEVVTTQENTIRGKTSKLNKHKSSKYVGVHFCKTSKKWIASSRINSKKKHIGSFNSEEEASKAYKKFKAEYANWESGLT